jgi:hypothetical protein
MIMVSSGGAMKYAPVTEVDSDWGIPKHAKKNLSPCHSVRTKSTSTGLGSNPRLHDTTPAKGDIYYNSACKQTDSQSGRASAIC